MAFTLANFEWIVRGNSNVMRFGRYVSTSETWATIVASAYFNDIINELSVGDWILIRASDDAGFVNVTSVTTNVTVAAASLPVASLTGSDVAVVADDNVIGGIPLIYRIDMAGGATANADITVTHKIRVIDAWVVLRGAGTTSDTIQLKNGTTNAITDALDISGSDQAVVRAGTINDAYHEIAAAGILRVTETDGGSSDSPACTVYVSAIRVA